MNHDIGAIFIDTGNTMRIVKEDPVFQLRARNKPDGIIGQFSELLNLFFPRN